MTDLVGARYPLAYEEWMFDGQPLPPFRQSMKRSDITSGTAGVTAWATGKMYVTAVSCSPGDVINYVTIGVASLNSGTVTHSWAAIYSAPSTVTYPQLGGMQSGATLLTQSVDLTPTIATGAIKMALGSTVLVGGVEGTTQGAANAAGASGPVILGVALMFAWTTAGPTLDGTLGGTAVTIGTGLAGSSTTNSYSGQAPLALIAGSSLTTTAPATLTGATGTGTGVLPYILLSKF